MEASNLLVPSRRWSQSDARACVLNVPWYYATVARRVSVVSACPGASNRRSHRCIADLDKQTSCGPRTGGYPPEALHTKERSLPMHTQRIPEGLAEPSRLDRAILVDHLLVHGRPLAEYEIAREVGVPGDVPVALRRLRVARLVHRWNDLATPSLAAVRFIEVMQPADADLEFIEGRRDRGILETLLSEDDGAPMSEPALTCDEEQAVAALDRLDAAGLADRRAGLVVASEPARRFAYLLTL
jgi:hypothetical protein